MSSTETVVGVLIAVIFVVMILYVLLGQITVRKLRKNPETKNELGMEFVSGWDIINVAQALAIPAFIIRRFKDTPLSFLYANAELLIKHTNKFDRVLAFIFGSTRIPVGHFPHPLHVTPHQYRVFHDF